MTPGYKAFPCFNMVQFEGIWIIHLPDLLLKARFGKIPRTRFVINLFTGPQMASTTGSVSKNHYVELRGEVRRSRTF